MTEQELRERARILRVMAATQRLAASMSDFPAAVSEATIGMQRLADALAIADWPEVILEDILDAEYIEE